METDKERQRRGFVADHESGQWSMTELCQRYRISRPTGYELLRRVEAEGPGGLLDRSRAPRSCPHQTPAEVEQLILALRAKYGWGAKKLLQVLEKQHPRIDRPARIGQPAQEAVAIQVVARKTKNSCTATWARSHPRFMNSYR